MFSLRIQASSSRGRIGISNEPAVDQNLSWDCAPTAKPGHSPAIKLKTLHNKPSNLENYFYNVSTITGMSVVRRDRSKILGVRLP